MDPIHVPVAQEIRAYDPTGVGDGFRAGFFAARRGGWAWSGRPRSARCWPTLVLETVGTQEYEVRPAVFVKRLAESYGDAAADESHLPPLPGQWRWAA